MKKSYPSLPRRLSALALTALSAAVLGTSCVSNKKISYFKDVSDTVYQVPVATIATSYTEPKIQPKDILQVTIQTLDPQANSVISSSNAAQAANNNLAQAAGYQVDREGAIQLPIAGRIQVAGKTTAEATTAISAEIGKFYKQPVVNVRFANFNITVLGEVARPATYTVPNEKISVLEALGLAGDLTIYGKRENVLIIREEEGTKKFVRFNLNSSDIIRSPYFYLRQGDVVYVEPNKSKVTSTDATTTRTITIVASALSVLIVLLSKVNF